MGLAVHCVSRLVTIISVLSYCFDFLTRLLNAYKVAHHLIVNAYIDVSYAELACFHGSVNALYYYEINHSFSRSHPV